MNAKTVKVQPEDIAGLTKIEALVYLGSQGLDAKSATEFYNEHKTQRAGITAGFYASLVAGPMNDEGFAAFLASGTDNTRRHESHFRAIMDLANAIHSGK